MKVVPLVMQGLCRWMARTRLGAAAAVAAGSAAGVFGAVPAAQAQVQAPAPPQPDLIRLRPAGVALPRDPQGVDMRVVIAAPRASERAAADDRSSLSRAALIAMPADQIPGQYSRPKYALGFRSEGMKQFAKGMGLDADTCLAPLIRGRVSFTAGGDGSARLMVFARCSFH
jgi:hypothetical protein